LVIVKIFGFPGIKMGSYYKQKTSCLSRLFFFVD
jgi:hypothetical protein